MKNILFVFGTRPEVIKLAPVILELKKFPDKYNVIVCNTEQQKELSNQTLAYFGLKADINLDCMKPNQSLLEVQTRILSALDKVFDNNKIDATIVQGDTMTVLCGALASFYRKIPVYHVEAGLRSYDIYEPFPEEVMRQMTSRVAKLNFAPTEKNRQALLKENISDEKIHVVGNTVIDALFCLSDETMNAAERYFKDSGIIVDDKLVLITAHRRENHGERIDRILDAVEYLVKKYAAIVTPKKKITPHKLRSSYGSALYAKTNDIYLVADLLGHNDVNITRKFYAAIEENRRKSVKNIDIL